MYGYIRVYEPELKVREQEYYRAVYCGLCRTMGKCTGQCSRASLSYDFTFFALLRMALSGERVTVKVRRCAIHPARRRLMAEPNDALRLASCFSAILAYHKLRDDQHDEKGAKRALATCAIPYVASIRRRAIKRGYVDADRQVSAAMRALAALEAASPPSVDEPADLFGDLMAALLSVGLDGDRARVATAAGRHLGRWIYILDAADDFEEDVRRGRYNPFACLYADPTMKTLPTEKREEIRIALLSELTELEKAFDLLDVEDDPDLSGLLSNVLYLGLLHEADRILGRCSDPESHKRQKSPRRKHKHGA